VSRLEVITGPMFSGKTEELLRRLRREEIAGKIVYVAKPAIDSRYDKDAVVSHNGSKMKTKKFVNSWDIDEFVRTTKMDILGVDEAQFFDSEFALMISHILSNDTIKIIISGLASDFTTSPFGSMPDLMLMADKLDKLTAVCNKCGADDASFTQRLVDGKPAAFDGPTILVGGTESYEARCRDCFEVG
jgi:thymidine kinase